MRGFDIEGSECEGYGFRVLNCDGFSLAPDEQRDVDIAFTPDFTLSLLTRTLSVRSSLGGEAATINYTIEASVPYHMLAVCSQALPRPAWEPYLFYSLNSFMAFVLVCVAVAVYTESDRVAKSSRLEAWLGTVQRPEHQQQQQHNQQQQQSYEGSNGVFDLRGIQSQVNQELNLRQRSNAAPASNGVSGSSGAGASRGRSGNRGSPPQSAPPPNREPGLTNGKFFEGLQKTQERDLWILQLISWPAERLSSGFKWILKLPILLSGWRSSLSPPVVSTSSPLMSYGTKNKKPESGNRESTPCSGGKQSSSAAATPVPQGKKAKRRQQQLARRQLSRKASYEEVETASNTTESSNVEEDFGERSSHNHSNHNNTKGTSSNNHDLSSSFSQLPPTTAEQISGKKGNVGKGKGANNASSVGGKKVAPAPVLPVEDGTKKNSSKPKKSNNEGKHQQEQNKSKEVQQQQKKQEANSGSKAKDSISAKGISSKLQITTDTQKHQKLAKSDSNGITSSRSNSGVTFDKPPRMQQQVKDNGHSNQQDSARNQQLHQQQQQQQPQQQPKPKVPPPVGKILPEPKRTENVGAQYGAIGSSLRGAGVMPRKSTWSDSPAEAKPLPPHHAHSMFGPIAAAAAAAGGNERPPVTAADMSVPPPPTPPPMTPHQEPSDYARYQQPPPPPSAPGTPSPGYLPGSPVHAPTAHNNNGSVASSSLMQSLQAERRQRTEEYLRHHPQTATSPDWPGFEHQFGGAGDFINNLWDNPMVSQQQQQRRGAQPHNNGGAGGGIAAGHGNWGVSEDIWPNAYPLNLQQQLGNVGNGIGEAGNFGGVNRSNSLFDHMNSFNYVPADAPNAGNSIWDTPVKEQEHQQPQNNGGGGGNQPNNTWATLFNKEPTT